MDKNKTKLKDIVHSESAIFSAATLLACILFTALLIALAVLID